jgi:hypothetical protein
MAASIIVRARQVVPALAANKFATLRFQPLGTNRAEIDGMLFLPRLPAGMRSKHATIRVCMHSSFHGPKVIAQPGVRGKHGNDGVAAQFGFG